MILLFTDFGIGSPYVGQMKAVIAQQAPETRVIELFSNAPAYNIKAAAYLLAAYVDEFPLDSIFLTIIDPGVGSDRKPLIMRANGRWFVGPDNGLFNVVASRSQSVKFWQISWAPEKLSSSFHGRDLFAPVAARLALNEPPPGELLENDVVIKPDWQDDLLECIYVDNFGNVMTGLRASQMPDQAQLQINQTCLSRAQTFSDVDTGSAFWYENANGLVEIAVNQGNAAGQLSISVGDKISLLK